MSSKQMGVKAVVLSGGPSSVLEEDHPGMDPALLKSGIPLLGICYGMQLITLVSGGTVDA
jgi:GMP synthase (glutamine-hydrolysing)